MKTISQAHFTAGVCAAVIIIAGCGGGSPSPSFQPPGSSDGTRTQRVSSVAVPDAACHGQQSFSYTGQSQKFNVPKCATTVYVDTMGAAGAYCANGGQVSATIPVTPAETLIVTVGSQGSVAKGGGFNGGGRGAKNRTSEAGASGGGASDVRQAGSGLTNRVVVAGGGGSSSGRGGGGPCGSGGGIPDGGNGGNPDCDYGHHPNPGSGGTQSSGGAGGTKTNGGSLGKGGDGVGSCLDLQSGFYNRHWSAGGGGGYYGGGGGANGGESGGGSGYAEPSATNVSSQNGVNALNGSVLICWGYSNQMCGTR
jgi:hypothetical protein